MVFTYCSECLCRLTRMQVKTVSGIVLLLVALLFLNYALLYEFYGDKTVYSVISGKLRIPKNKSRLGEDISFNSTTEKTSPLSSTAVAETTISLSPTTSLVTTDKKPCNEIGLQGSLRIDFAEFEKYYWQELNLSRSDTHNETYFGDFAALNTPVSEAVYLGRTDCKPMQWVAIIIPFRDRESHLKILLGHLLPILRRQGVRFSVFVVEQIGKGIFNKGRVMNTGFNYAYAAGIQHGTPFDCFVFQDVDLLPESDTLLYKCSGGNFVDHLSTTINKFDYKPLCCGMTVGGVLAFSGEQFKKVNGFPNNFWGWGGEDDAMNQRIRSKQLHVRRPNYTTGRYTMIKHEREEMNPYNHESAAAMKEAQKGIDVNGLKNLNTTVVAVEKYQLFMRVYVDVGKAES